MDGKAAYMRTIIFINTMSAMAIVIMYALRRLNNCVKPLTSLVIVGSPTLAIGAHVKSGCQRTSERKSGNLDREDIGEKDDDDRWLHR